MGRNIHANLGVQVPVCRWRELIDVFGARNSYEAITAQVESEERTVTNVATCSARGLGKLSPQAFRPGAPPSRGAGKQSVPTRACDLGLRSTIGDRQLNELSAQYPAASRGMHGFLACAPLYIDAI